MALCLRMPVPKGRLSRALFALSLPVVAIAVSIVAVLSCSAVARIRAAGHHAPKLTLPCALDLGIGEPGTRLRGEFDISNDGTQPLSFRITPSCGCTHVQPMTGVIPPGSSVAIAVGLQLDGRPGAMRSVAIMVDSNDLTTPRARYHIFGKSLAPFVVRPDQIDFGRIIRGPSSTRIVTVRSSDGTSISGSLQPPEFTIIGSAFRVTHDRSFPDDFQLSVQLKPQDRVGRLYGHLLLRSHLHLKELSVPISAEIVDKLTIIPEHIRISSNTYDWKSQIMIWRSDRAALSGPVTIDCDGDLAVEEVTTLHDFPRRRFVLRLTSGRMTTSRKVRFTFESADGMLNATTTLIGIPSGN